MRILLLTFYYPPDLSAGSFRAQALVEALQEVGPEDLEIDVLTTLPNRYHSANWGAPEQEQIGPVTIRRLPLPQHRSGMVDQSLAFSSFARSVWRETRGGGWDAVVATSSRLMTAALGAEIARRHRVPLYLDIRDLFTDTMGDLLASSMLRHVLPLFRWLERRTFRRADRINAVSPGFLPHLQAIAPQHSYRLFTNGIDDAFLEADFDPEVSEPEDERPLILYAGNLGDGQGLHHILPQAAYALESRARFRVLGDGGRRTALEQGLAEYGVTNVELLPPVPRTELFEHYREADILFLHLNDHDAFRKVLPSKLFEYAATGKPILGGVAGYAQQFLQQEVPGAEVFEPCSVKGCLQAFEALQTTGSPVPREAFTARYARQRIMRDMASDILELVREPQAPLSRDRASSETSP